jgi:hypothetical protein
LRTQPSLKNLLRTLSMQYTFYSKHSACFAAG